MFDDVNRSLYILWLINSILVNKTYVSLKQDKLEAGKGEFKYSWKTSIHI